ncbi:MAG: LytR/AlgR family response regulator transcription factor [Opitutaceae bacterium]
MGIIEDCESERLHLATILGQLPGYVVEFEANSLESARAMLGRFRPQIVLLDLFLGRESGLSLIEELAMAGSRVIVTTAHRLLGPEAFEAGVVDYLLKPISEARLLTAFARARAGLRSGNDVLVVFRGGAPRSLVTLDSVGAVIADGDYSLVSVGNLLLRDHRRISDWEELLSSHGGARLDRSTVVRPHQVVGWQPYGLGATLQLAGSRNRIELGRAGYRRFRQVLQREGMADDSPVMRTSRRQAGASD